MIAVATWRLITIVTRMLLVYIYISNSFYLVFDHIWEACLITNLLLRVKNGGLETLFIFGALRLTMDALCWFSDLKFCQNTRIAVAFADRLRRLHQRLRILDEEIVDIVIIVGYLTYIRNFFCRLRYLGLRFFYNFFFLPTSYIVNELQFLICLFLILWVLLRFYSQWLLLKLIYERIWIIEFVFLQLILAWFTLCSRNVYSLFQLFWYVSVLSQIIYLLLLFRGSIAFGWRFVLLLNGSFFVQFASLDLYLIIAETYLDCGCATLLFLAQRSFLNLTSTNRDSTFWMAAKLFLNFFTLGWWSFCWAYAFRILSFTRNILRKLDESGRRRLWSSLILVLLNSGLDGRLRCFSHYLRGECLFIQLICLFQCLQIL